jgi:hypothetical protein
MTEQPQNAPDETPADSGGETKIEGNEQVVVNNAPDGGGVDNNEAEEGAGSTGDGS